MSERIEMWNKKKYTNYLIHHGIDGQKWGVRNGPPYPLDYEDHSAAEKKANSRAELTGDRRIDKKIIESTYKEAKYAKAASLLSKDQSDRKQTKALKREKKVGKDSKYEQIYSEGKRLSAQSKKADENSKYFSDKYQRQISEYVDRYGKENFKKFSQDKIDRMTVSKASNFIANNGMSSYSIAGGFVGGAIGGGVAGGVKGYANYKEYEKYIDSL